MFVDTAKVFIKAGKGGDGAVSFRHEIYIPKGGPDGGDGGRGGDVIFKADKDTNTLLDFRYQPKLEAKDGASGGKRNMAGRYGKNLVVKVPVGTIVKRVAGEDQEIVVDLASDGQEAVVAKGGKGGFGNAHFKSSVRQAPRVAEVGEPGDEYEAELELKLLADVGLIGFPNAGKSTLLSVVSNARPEIADYAFTTLTPNLGVATVDGDDLLLADIPGLIEGASEGKGLGDNFLRHVERTAVLLHMIDAYSGDTAGRYKIIRRELESYNKELVKRPEVVVLTKVEGLDAEMLQMLVDDLRKVAGKRAKILTISAQAHIGLTELLRVLKDEVNKYREKETKAAGEFEDKDDVELEVIRLTGAMEDDFWAVDRVDDDKFVVTGKKIEGFARRTDLKNVHSVNRLRDIMKKMGIKNELVRQGAAETSVIEIAGKSFGLLEE